MSFISRKLNEIPGQHFDDTILTKRARIPFEALAGNDALEKLKAVIEWLIEQVKAECGKGVSENDTKKDS